MRAIKLFLLSILLSFVVMVESVQPVPEPGTIALLGIGLAGLVGVGMRKRAKNKIS